MGFQWSYTIIADEYWHASHTILVLCSMWTFTIHFYLFFGFPSLRIDKDHGVCTAGQQGHRSWIISLLHATILSLFNSICTCICTHMYFHYLWYLKLFHPLSSLHYFASRWAQYGCLINKMAHWIKQCTDSSGISFHYLRSVYCISKDLFQVP